ncbi:ATP-dependent Clp protease proteolytic subunit [Georgenia sp. TF02-10]|uniref:ClpP family protease n=1 Tax=Georgenia sp. TF02-10 TaxID=2917725 RepID=UPI001FA769B0|nr:ATP-dependent Clp protease proteolytic subunit [Georgenia sp. TF02-10]UNX54642.1 ATP-dependent Clp protease proteolytic subunit [Georgenia sp. TF02-10]
MASYPIPYVTTQTPRGERTVDIYSRLLAERIVYLGTEIDDGVANALIAQLIHLESESTDQPISFYINSPGGSVTAMLAVYDTMQYVRAPIATTCVGQAASSAAVLLAGGEPGQRAMLTRARVILHQPATEGRGAVPDLILEAEEVARVRAMLEELIAKDTGRTVAQVREDTERDLVLTAPQALDYGLVDHVLDRRPAPAGAALLAG